MNITILAKKLLGVSVVTKARCGFLVALSAMISIGGKMAVTFNSLLSRNEATVCIAIGSLGFLLWLIGLMSTAKPAVQDEPTSQQPPEEEDPLAFLFSSKYWGFTLVFAAALLSFFISFSHFKRPGIARARALVTVTVTNVVTITNEAPRLSWPALAVQGVVVNGAKSSALINGRVLHLGEAISNVVLVAVTSERAAVALEGQTNWLSLRK